MFRIGMVRMVDWVISEEESLLGEGVDTLARNGLAITSHSREVCSQDFSRVCSQIHKKVYFEMHYHCFFYFVPKKL